jgi:predicted RNase H-like HicB family nuclease
MFVANGELFAPMVTHWTTQRALRPLLLVVGCSLRKFGRWRKSASFVFGRPEFSLIFVRSEARASVSRFGSSVTVRTGCDWGGDGKWVDMEKKEAGRSGHSSGLKRRYEGALCENLGVRTYAVVIHEDTEGRSWGEVPALPGCYSQGDTIDELKDNIRKAMAGVLEVLREQGREPVRAGTDDRGAQTRASAPQLVDASAFAPSSNR